MPPRLIINADDFGLTSGINRAIAELHRARALTSATLMATGPAFIEAVAIAKDNPTLGVGCHVVLTDGIPVSHPDDIPTLLGADGKTFRPSLLDFAQAILRGRVNPDDITRETFAQVQKLQRAGVDITHLDTHKHSHLFPIVTRSLLHVAERCNIGAIRNPFEPTWAFALGHGSALRRLEIRVLDHAFRRRFDTHLQTTVPNVATTDGTSAVSTTGDLTSATLSQILEALPSSGTWELVVHPGYNDEALSKIATRLRNSRDVEREALLTNIPNLQKNPSPPELIHYGSLGPYSRIREIGQFTPASGYEHVL
ncbi:ChbG/HpnK family deacetylase [Granulicella sibirica]|uniref:Cellobiose phosphotransferase system YdjC-like protein n=1 Tax=Granulicella sibirica TaxID=2479048 RepID=A0A4Q0T1L2_9BACT|nr:ChbG/HpnK family deacetylase [Granulicella sibirica]RXH55858.1 Cellobiose phosphotransferase system YdjC-like protein [Granulicella sibirica]